MAVFGVGNAEIGQPKDAINAGAASLIDVAGWQNTVSEHAGEVVSGVAAAKGLLHQLESVLGAMANPLERAYGGERAVSEGIVEHAGRLATNVRGSEDQGVLDAAAEIGRQVKPTEELAAQLGGLVGWHAGLTKMVAKAKADMEGKDCEGAARTLPDATKDSARTIKGAAEVLRAKGLSL